MAKRLSCKVFFNFGEELRYDFIWRLKKALKDGGIRFFIGEQLYPSDDLQTFLKQHIEDPKIALAVFSKRYSQSERCLNELVNIMEKVEENKLIVIPIFFNVKVEDVKHQTGEFGRNLYGGGRRDRSDMPQRKKALKSVTDKKGLCRVDYRSDIEFIDHIVLTVKQVLSMIPLVSEQPSRDFPISGFEQRLKQLEEKFTKRMVSRPQQHQVFINFRGAQLRNNFVSHLVAALRRNRINVFIDKQENKGEDISNLLKRVEDSRIAIVVFSSKYTESTWCLREAEKIMERVAQGKLNVLPIFYKVPPTNVKLLIGEFGEHFRIREWEYRHEKAVIEKWKEALVFISGKLGLTLDEKSDETDFIASIVTEILRMLTSIPLATQTEESHANRFSHIGETSNSASCGISSAKSDMGISHQAFASISARL